MSKIKASDFVENVLSMLGAPYESPGNTIMGVIRKGGGVDCSGLTVAAGGSSIHGSNSQWRKDLTEKGRISDGKPTDPYPAGNDKKSSQLELGMVVFRHKAQDSKYYRDGLGDYSHEGVVTGVNPLRITHASTEYGRVVTVTKVGTFCAWGKLKGVDYGEQAIVPVEKEQTMTENMGKLKLLVNVNVRKGPGTNYDRIGGMKVGTVTAYKGNVDDGWVCIDLNGTEGWICTKQNGKWFVNVIETYTKTDTEPVEEDTSTDEPQKKQDDEDCGCGLKETVEELCEGSTTTAAQITAICRILRNAGYDISSVPGMRLPEDI